MRRTTILNAVEVKRTSFTEAENAFYKHCIIPFFQLECMMPIYACFSCQRAFLGQVFTHSMHKMHSVPFILFLELSVTSTFIGHTRLHLPQEIHLLLSHWMRDNEK